MRPSSPFLKVPHHWHREVCLGGFINFPARPALRASGASGVGPSGAAFGSPGRNRDWERGSASPFLPRAATVEVLLNGPSRRKRAATRATLCLFGTREIHGPRDVFIHAKIPMTRGSLASSATRRQSWRRASPNADLMACSRGSRPAAAAAALQRSRGYPVSPLSLRFARRFACFIDSHLSCSKCGGGPVERSVFSQCAAWRGAVVLLRLAWCQCSLGD